MAQSTRRSSRHPSTVRIIGGRWRGRKIAVADVAGLRPTGDRVRETVFNWLQADIVNATVLDMFAGTGVLGFEAVSRGASAAWLVEQDTSAYQQLQLNQSLLGSGNVTLVHADSLKWLAQSPVPENFSLVFIDPPFAAKLWRNALTLLARTSRLAADARVYLEYPSSELVELPAGWSWYRQANAGAVGFGIATPGM